MKVKIHHYGQSSLEYLLMLSCTVLIGVVIVLLMLNLVEEGKGVVTQESGNTFSLLNTGIQKTPGVIGKEGVFVYPSESHVQPGNIVPLQVRIEEAEALNGFQISLSYPPSLLSLISVTEGGFLNSNGSVETWEIMPDRSVPGKITDAVYARLSPTPVTGNGVLLELTFVALQPGTASIEISEVTLSDGDASPIWNEEGETMVAAEYLQNAEVEIT